MLSISEKKRSLTPSQREAANRLYRLWRSIKDSKGLTQKKAARLMGFRSQTTISMYLHGHMPLGTDAIVRFANLLGVNPEEIAPDLSENFRALSGAISKVGPKEINLTNDELTWVELFRRLLDNEKKVFMETLRCITANRADTRVTATH